MNKAKKILDELGYDATNTIIYDPSNTIGKAFINIASEVSSKPLAEFNKLADWVITKEENIREKNPVKIFSDFSSRCRIGLLLLIPTRDVVNVTAKLLAVRKRPNAIYVVGADGEFYTEDSSYIFWEMNPKEEVKHTNVKII